MRLTAMLYAVVLLFSSALSLPLQSHSYNNPSHSAVEARSERIALERRDVCPPGMSPNALAPILPGTPTTPAGVACTDDKLNPLKGLRMTAGYDNPVMKAALAAAGQKRSEDDTLVTDLNADGTSSSKTTDSGVTPTVETTSSTTTSATPSSSATGLAGAVGHDTGLRMKSYYDNPAMAAHVLSNTHIV
ncbi:MAG: hypothetical protein Q9220_007386 [cf. Caloplaca sp. 1 TL-2023]